jgi:hypothetical protein
MRCCEVWYIFIGVLDEPAVSIFIVDEVFSRAPGMNSPFSYIHTILLSWLAYLSTLKMEEAESSVNAGKCLPDYMASYPRRP